MTVHDNLPRPSCPRCNSSAILKNGSTHHKQQKYLCKDCRYQFINKPNKKFISSTEESLVKSLLLERISPAGIARVLNISPTWIQIFVNRFLRQIPCEIKDIGFHQGTISLECDEIWSFVKGKYNPEWIWLAILQETRQIVGFYLGDRSQESAKKLWESIPESIRQCQIVYTDGLKSYIGAIPQEKHQPTSKGSGKTNHIERFNNTIRQRCSRLVRKGLSFSKSCFNHEGAIWYFIHHYNASLQRALL